ncbi:hypothetical protein BST25_17940 [Mycobacterium heidelbergense]|uniref:Uncharacterized protein n=1 Tax=Mycobacterium heidelbergense TaxID=53376 RepID=A0A1X0DGP3_MYCHE|nr:hypothetical protein [Mycobacterium heidelbergense]ORA71000.1 hypothetical protein BST25_17940 [Mycobacterium heidelbergense]BBZ52484.1 hypothetical protein MHEI_42010 [Mycobacterium heidelbergense]
MTTTGAADTAADVEWWVFRLSKAARAGAVFDPTDGKPVDPADGARWPVEHCLPAAALRRVLTDRELAVDPRGLRIRAVRIRDGLDLANITFPHPLHLVSCALDVGVDLSGAEVKELSFAGSHTERLLFDQAAITGDVQAGEGFTVHGEVRAIGVHIGGQLILDGATLRNPGGNALALDGADIRGGIFAGEGFTTEGEVRAVGARIGGQVNLNGATLRNRGGDALSLDGADISDEVFASDGFTAEGGVRFPRARIGANLTLDGANLSHPGGEALSLNWANIGGDVSAKDRFTADGEVRAIRARIGGNLDLAGATLRNPGGNALGLDNTEINGEMFADDGFTVDGQVRAHSVRVGGGLSLRRATVRNPGGNALNLEAASVKRLILEQVDVEGVVRLYRTVIGDLVTEENPPKPFVATGWEVTDIHGPLRDNSAAARRWLASTRETSAQPWHALAAVYERNGDPASARRLRVAAANKVTRQSPWPTRVLRSVYGAVVGHGYYPLLAGVWIAVIVLIGSVTVAWNRDDFVQNRDATNSAAVAYLHQTRNPPPTEAPFRPISYTLSALLPATVGNAASGWTIRATWLSFLLNLLKLTSWALTALFVAGITGLLRKDKG